MSNFIKASCMTNSVPEYEGQVVASLPVEIVFREYDIIGLEKSNRRDSARLVLESVVDQGGPRFYYINDAEYERLSKLLLNPKKKGDK